MFLAGANKVEGTMSWLLETNEILMQLFKGSHFSVAAGSTHLWPNSAMANGTMYVNRDWIKKNCEKKPGNNFIAKIIYLHSTNIRQPDYTICYLYVHHFMIYIPRFERQKPSRLSTWCKILFTLGLFANKFSLRSLSLSLKSHMNVLWALKLTGIQVYCLI